MKISISQAEKDEKASDRAIATNIIKLRQALRGNSPKLMAQALHDYELPNKTVHRFEMTIEWGILGTDKVELWKQIKIAYEAIGAQE